MVFFSKKTKKKLLWFIFNMLTSVKVFDKEMNCFIRFKKGRKDLKVDQHNSAPLHFVAFLHAP
jgi:hypothetical protein